MTKEEKINEIAEMLKEVAMEADETEIDHLYIQLKIYIETIKKLKEKKNEF